MLQKKFNEEYSNGSIDEQVKNFMHKEIKIPKNQQEISLYSQAQANILTSYVPVECSSIRIIPQRKQLPNWSDFMSKAKKDWSDFMSKAKKDNLNKEAIALRQKKSLKSHLFIHTSLRMKLFSNFQNTAIYF